MVLWLAQEQRVKVMLACRLVTSQGYGMTVPRQDQSPSPTGDRREG